DCFIRQLRDGARPIDPAAGVLVSPCDGIIGECGRIHGQQLVQAKGIDYPLEQLVLSPALADVYRDGVYVTLRLTSTMYHRFHAPEQCEVTDVRFIAGDTWNVNPATLKRVRNVFCRNERAVITARLAGASDQITLVAVAAILVGGIKLAISPAIFN